MGNKYLSYRTFWILVASVLIIGFLYSVYYFFFEIPKPIEISNVLTEEEKLKLMKEASKDIQPSPLSESDKLKIMRESSVKVSSSTLSYEEKISLMEGVDKK